MMLWDVYYKLIEDDYINEKVGSRIKFYEYPETGDVSGPHIIIDPIAPPRPVKTADNQRIIYEYFYQIDFWSKSMNDTENSMKSVADILWSLGFVENGSEIDEYDSETQIYRQAKRFIGQFEKIKE